MSDTAFRTVIVGLGNITRSMLPIMQSFSWFKPSKYALTATINPSSDSSDPAVWEKSK